MAILAHACATMLVLTACETQSGGNAKSGRGLPPVQDGVFLRTEGTQLRLGDRTVRFVGVNAALIHGTSTRDAMPRILESLERDALGLARVWALGENEGDESWKRTVAFRLGPDEWVEESFLHLDRLLVEAREHRIRVVIVLMNRWGDYGGMPQYMRWAGHEPRYRNLLPSEEAFAMSHERIQAMFMDHLERIVSRTNSISGVAYRDDPTIAAWELFNEMGARTCAMQQAFVSWVERFAARIRELDPNHLIAAGHIGYNSEQSLRFWREVHALPAVDYADTHGYPQNLLYATTADRLGAWLGHRAREAQRLGKPLIVGEIGVPRRDDSFQRVPWLERFVQHAERNGTDAVMVWIYRGDERDDPHGIWAWGPFADETAPVRHLFTEASKRWLRDDARTDPEAPHDFPLGLTGIRPYARGEQEGSELVLDPWQLAEGCVDEERGWTEYAIPWSARRETFALDFGEAERGTLVVELDGERVGTWTAGRFERSPGALPAGDWAWLRLEAEDPGGVELLRTFTRNLPGSEAIRIRAQ